ncbi:MULTISPECIES: phosphoglucosamine mutase [Psychrobacter]|jgi:phosphoglucosamine mutase|uniref:phosphoglucosamine mutase n=1 Tax=Psychrobacter TaxID=497 RepID=UPI000C34DE53|nr:MULTISPECIES: phosphoglucosamine mutase [Psychrobacter]MBA6243226.1 phosphoglucosamine mutase [Psychrobacter sp. Urea-trap-18]MBA6286284.1 phosphoglucosamine mutase [Psychrobacter sp. Urea-trap-16]MBA6317433.1 phosphoglucosamine mutase [Psychrobacter sp. Urea-trap-20]MBA6334539.1 phosphoglucosamine mutase [Psychrobacter sp. Urea-trap-19]PKG60916.1 phosphoglucosamine mutase [Psychrobacter sp. Choline-3u-12]
MSYFGTDGIRGKFGELPITPDFILKLGYVTGLVLIEKNENLTRKPSVVIGKDTRLSGYVIEGALQAGFNAAGVDVYMLGPLPTPAIAHLTRSFNADAGVVISASHNPYYDNGIKFFSGDGKKISDEMQTAINDKLTAIMNDVGNDIAIMPILDPANLGKNNRIDDAKGRYIEFCKGSFPYQYDLSHLKVVVDCANGAGYSVAPRVMRELGANVIAINNTPDGININAECGSTHPESLQKAVLEHEADVGIALDGDGDRIVMVDETGKLVDGDGILYVLATQGRTKAEGVVGTLMSNMGLELALKDANIQFTRAKVGDRYVMQDLEANGWILGGEPSGHILCLDKSRTGDAIIAGLQVLAVMQARERALSELVEGFEVLPQKLVNVRLSQMQDPFKHEELVAAFDKAQATLEGRGRLLIRQSGTEPMIRVMVESDDEIECDVMANDLADLIKSVLG